MKLKANKEYEVTIKFQLAEDIDESELDTALSDTLYDFGADFSDIGIYRKTEK
jgi:hypothetical protein